MTDLMFPSVVSKDLIFCQVALGWNHILALTNDGQVYADGCWQGISLNVIQDPTMSLSHEKQGITPLIEESRLSSSDGSLQNTELCNSCERDQSPHWNPNHSRGMTELNAMKGESASKKWREIQPCAVVQESYAFRLHLLEPLKESRVSWVAAGAEHSSVALDDGTVLTWGWGEHGQLGLGTTRDQSLPQNVPLLPRTKELKYRIFCGSGFTYICMAA